jgi:hypothetical protein
LLAGLRGGDVEADDAGEGADEQHQSGRAAQVSAEVGADRGECDRDGDEAHYLAEQRTGLVVRYRLCPEGRLVGGGLERAHVTTMATGKSRR